ncbi:urea ABC transporter permease subunit UrtC [Microbacterium sp. Leaf288]|uniref:urea ABC transporter permease subunit UrtC n=1 Tax=Microbacterium sp. Leaf288 TaxID=1736323 RepID=UPI0006FD0445|nr:urea ABC transporter permease subunit UrtC [Microbacterium sp. Leaf288]KQP73922.1 urea ABC transporter permease subunit UrtC [Microbacterium sp. Leaf288]
MTELTKIELASPDLAKPVTRNRSPRLSLIGIAVFAVLLLAVAPSVLSMHWINNLGKYCAWAIVAVGIGLAWGRGGMLVMGQGVFFALGAYSMAMHMTLETAGPDATPTFMILYDPLAAVPAFWEPFRSELFTVLAIVLLPVIVAGVLGFALFKRRVKGAYFAILTQALAVALAVLVSSTIRETGGDTGLSDFKYFFGYVLNDDANKLMIYMITVGLLIVCMLVAWQLYRSRFGELLLATRDAEDRVRFLGYDPANIKLVAFVIAAVMASIGGAMFVPLVGIITPQEIGASASILFIAGVALGGRASLFGPVLGAMAIGWGQSSLASSWPEGWIYILGLLFIVVTLFLPNGLASLIGRMWTAARSTAGRRTKADRGLAV